MVRKTFKFEVADRPASWHRARVELAPEMEWSRLARIWKKPPIEESSRPSTILQLCVRNTKWGLLADRDFAKTIPGENPTEVIKSFRVQKASRGYLGQRSHRHL